MQYPDQSIFAIRILNQFILYAPLHGIAALVNHAAVRYLQESLLRGDHADDGLLGDIARTLDQKREPLPLPKQGDFSPAFLGILPTRHCNLACRYCSFLPATESSAVLDLGTARDAVEWYMHLVRQMGAQFAEVHYFGGEPFCAEQVLDLTIPLARMRARQIGCQIRFEVATNGVFNEERAQWAAENFDTIVFSFDGLADIQDRHRPYRHGQGTFAVVARIATVLSEGTADLFFRTCITDQTVDRMSEIAVWFSQNYRPRGVCFETVQPTTQSEEAGLEPPDPWKFARAFIQAAWILEVHGVEPIYTAADIRARRVSFCPVGQDAAIVSPDGTLSACYLLQRDWKVKGLDLRLGRLEAGTAYLDANAIAFARSLNVWNKPCCARCFCKWHCAGGCHINHQSGGSPGTYGRLCIQTRAIALRNILDSLGRDDLVHDWLQNQDAMECSVLQASDLLFDIDK
jgi:radical SAM protein with 4Fe4S-binding SPASM domain